MTAAYSGIGLVVFETHATADRAATGPRAYPHDDQRAWNIEGVAVYAPVASVGNQSVADLASQYHQGWVDRDPDTIVALHTEESTFHIHGLTDPAVGNKAVRGLIASLLTLVPDLHFEAKRFYVGTDHIVFEYDMSGTTEGVQFVCDGVDVIAVNDGLVARKDTYLDLVALADQVGTLPQIVVGVSPAVSSVKT